MLQNTIAPLFSQIKIGAFANIVITTHHKPDGDAMGSSLALCALLKPYCKNVQVITPTDYNALLNYLPGNSEVINFLENEADATKFIQHADLFFCLDFNALSRINELGTLIESAGKPIAMIDHHMHPQDFAQFVYSNITVGSTCELVYECIETFFTLNEITADIANCLYTGTITDTGNFAHANTRAQTHTIAAELINRGANYSFIYEQMFNTFSPLRSKLFGYCLYEKMEIIADCKTAILWLNKEELNRFNVQTGDTEGLVNFGLSIEGVVFSILIVDRSERVKMSFRSKGKFAANTFASTYFNGGGHFNAAGGQSEDTLENVLILCKKALLENKEALLSI